MAMWNRFRDNLALDYVGRAGGNIILGLEGALRELSSILQGHGKTLEDFGLPLLETCGCEVEHELREWGSNADVLPRRASDAYKVFTAEQRAIFGEIMDVVRDSVTLYLFIDSKAGQGKTFLMNAIADHLRSHGQIMLPTAIAAYAAQLYRGGHTTHSTFNVCQSLTYSLCVHSDHS